MFFLHTRNQQYFPSLIDPIISCSGEKFHCCSIFCVFLNFSANSSIVDVFENYCSFYKRGPTWNTVWFNHGPDTEQDWREALIPKINFFKYVCLKEKELIAHLMQNISIIILSMEEVVLTLYIKNNGCKRVLTSIWIFESKGVNFGNTIYWAHNQRTPRLKKPKYIKHM